MLKLDSVVEHCANTGHAYCAAINMHASVVPVAFEANLAVPIGGHCSSK
jgi:hypothetical protein